jgi:hypothetical protein
MSINHEEVRIRSTGACPDRHRDGKFKLYDFVKFVRNSNCYAGSRASTKWDDPETIIRKGSAAQVMGTKGSWVALQITYAFTDSKYGNACSEVDGVKWY